MKGDAFSLADFEQLDRRSTAIRESAMIILKNYLRGKAIRAKAAT
jgi:hypothetical protein